MKISEDDLYIYPANKSMALDHLKAVKATPNLGHYLDWGINASKWNLIDHQKWINVATKPKTPYSSNAVYWKSYFVGMFELVPAADLYGVQFLYWVRGNVQGQGVATSISELLMQRVFLGNKWDYIEIHVDKENHPSEGVPKKLGFEIDETYFMNPALGTKGTGEMNVWVKYNPHYRIIRPEKIVKAERTFGYLQASQLMSAISHNFN